MPPLFLRRRLREGRLERDVAPLDGLGVGPGDLPRRRRVRPRAGRGIGPEVVVGRGRQADRLRRPAARRLTRVTVDYVDVATRQAPQNRGRRPEEVQARPRPRARRRRRVPRRRPRRPASWPFFGVSMPKAKIAPFVLNLLSPARAHYVGRNAPFSTLLSSRLYAQTPLRAPSKMVRNPNKMSPRCSR